MNRQLVVRESPGAFGRIVECPHCHGAIDISSTGQKWTVRQPGDIAERLRLEMAELEHESLRVVLLNTRNVVIEVVEAVRGSAMNANVRVGELFREAVRRNATRIVLVHNHPSGEVTPSPDDLHLTAEALAAGRLLDIDVLDHIVVGRDGWTSLRDRGIAFDGAGH